MHEPKDAIIFVHGLFSDSSAWADMIECVKRDHELASLFECITFEYRTPKFQVRPDRRIPDFEDLGHRLETWLDLRCQNYTSLVLVAHSQGGLIIQKCLERMIKDRRAKEFERIRAVCLFACPNSGSDFARSVRKYLRWWQHPQVKSLVPFDKSLIETQRTIYSRIVHAREETDASFPIRIVASFGDQDGIVTSQSAQQYFTERRALPGNHSSIIRPKDNRSLSYLLLRDELLRAKTGRGGVRAQQQSAVGLDPSSWQADAAVDHDELFGVTDLLRRVSQRITNPAGDHVVCLFGDGGIGKTTLAFEATRRAQDKQAFTRVAWVSAKSAMLDVSRPLEQADRIQHRWNDLLIQLADRLHLNLDPIPSQIRGLFSDGLRRLGPEDWCLLVVDNLETITDAEEAVRYLAEVVGRHKVLITSRASVLRISNGVGEERITPLMEAAAKEFGAYLGRQGSLDLGPADLAELADASEGNPLLLRLIVRLAIVGGQSIARVVEQIRDRAGFGAQINRYLYEASLDQLGDRVGVSSATALMNAFCSRMPGDVVDGETLWQLSGIASREQFEQARGAAVNLALIRALNGNREFTVHSLLREFICAPL
jgi:pimeloyl-ACP methyl ester carboxylesterase